jgi:hypothetical protein
VTNGHLSLSDFDEVLFRQVNPTWTKSDGTISSQAFKPTKKDNGKLSVDRSSKSTAQAAFEHHQAVGVSCCVIGVTVGEVSDLGLASFDDPTIEKPAHAYIDMSNKTRSELEGLAGRLRDLATQRGVLHSA